MRDVAAKLDELISAINRLCAIIEERVDDRLAYDVATAARKIGVSPRKLHDVIKMGGIRVARVGRRVLIAPEELKAFLRDLETR